MRSFFANNRDNDFLNSTDSPAMLTLRLKKALKRNRELEHTNRLLRRALAEADRGAGTVWSCCKKVGAWRKVEAYIRNRSEPASGNELSDD